VQLQHTIGNQGMQRLLSGSAEQKITPSRRAGHRGAAALSSSVDTPQDIVLDSELPGRAHALAATVEQTIHLGPDAARLPKPELDRLIAHESVHVAQQRLSGPPGSRSALEHEANALTAQALVGGPVHAMTPAPPSMALYDEQTIGTDAADQSLWVSRVDSIVRDRFGLNGVRTRMTDSGRVAFQDIGTYTGAFAGSAREMLLEVFVEDFSEYAFRIKDFYGLHVFGSTPGALDQIRQLIDRHIRGGFEYWDYHALDWAEYGLTGITSPSPYSSLERIPGRPGMATATLMHYTTRDQAVAAQARQPSMRYEVADGRDWPTDPQQTQLVLFHLDVPISRVTQRISAEEILAQTYGGITSGGARGRRRIHLRSTPARTATSGRPATPARPAHVSTLVHEACHFYTHDSFNRFVDRMRTAETMHTTPVTLTTTSTMRLAPILQEGFTEYFARMVMQENTATLGALGAGSYSAQYQAARLIINSMTPASDAESAYFHGDAASIQKVRDAIVYVEQNPNFVRVLNGMGMEETERAFEHVTDRPRERRLERRREREAIDMGVERGSPRR
jgi:Domain of unknown function (DUF4157)